MSVFNYPLPYSRPHTISDALDLVVRGYPRQVVFGDFADWLYYESNAGKIARAIAAKPELSLDSKELYYEYIGYLSFAEWLARQNGLPVPEWIAADKSIVPDSYYTPKMLAYRNKMLAQFADRAIPEYSRRGYLYD